MRDELANVIHPILLQGLRLKERVERGDLLNFVGSRELDTRAVRFEYDES